MTDISASLRFSNRELNESYKQLSMSIPAAQGQLPTDINQSMQAGELRLNVSMRHDDLLAAQTELMFNLIRYAKLVRRDIGQRGLYESSGDNAPKERRDAAALVALGNRLCQEFQDPETGRFSRERLREDLDRLQLQYDLREDVRKQIFFSLQISNKMYSSIDAFEGTVDSILKSYELGYQLLRELTTKVHPQTRARVPREVKEYKSIEALLGVFLMRKVFDKMRRAADAYDESQQEGISHEQALEFKRRCLGRLAYPQLALRFQVMLDLNEKQIMTVIKYFVSWLQKYHNDVTKNLQEAVNELTAVPDVTYESVFYTFTDLIYGEADNA